MIPTFEDLKEYAKEAREVAESMKRLTDGPDLLTRFCSIINLHLYWCILWATLYYD